MTKTELKTTLLLAGIYASRMLGLFLIFPTFSLLAQGLDNVTPLKIGLALGIYSLAQALLQIPAGILSDIIGRKKVLLIGLSLFLAGSVLAASTHDINVLILARLLQGLGAVSAVCLAYVADGVRGSEHGKAMAIIGISIAFSFILSFVFGSVIADTWGLSGLFILTTLLALMALGFAYSLPKTDQVLTVFKPADFVKVASSGSLLSVNIQVALLHAILSASFFLIPVLLKQYLPDASMILLYVPPIIVAFILIMPIIRKSKEKVVTRLPLFWLVFSVALGLLAATNAFEKNYLFMLVLGLFFFAFTFIEASLPTRLFQLATEVSRGATSGIFSVYQFGGSFLGGLIGAQLYTHFSESGTISSAFYVLAAMAVAMAGLTLRFNKKG